MARSSNGGPSPNLRPFGRRPAECRILMATGLVIVAITIQAGCVSAIPQHPAVAFVEPPREELEASLSRERIEANEVIQVRLADGTTASVTQTYYVGQDGTVEIAGHGKIQIAGKTLREAQQAIEQAVAVSESAKQIVELMLSEYYLVTVDESGAKRLTRVPIKGALTVKDALANVPGVSSKMIWIARPDPSRYLSEQILPVDWETVSREANSPTNHKLKPGDWLFVAEEPAQGLARVFNSFTGMFTSPETSRTVTR